MLFRSGANERAAKTAALEGMRQGQNLRSQGILARLGIQSQDEQNKQNIHVPYRDSKLTHILKDSLGRNSFTHLIITLSPSYLCLPETLSTLAFTKNTKAVK